MVSLNNMLKIVSFMLLVTLIGCNEKIFTGDVNCNDCYTEKPDSVDLIVHISIDNDTIPVVLYKGTIDEGELIDTFDCWENIVYFYVKADEYYSAKAIYKTSNHYVFAVDGIEQKLKKVSSTCDEACWVIEDVDLFLELKYK
jgi:hypothetical protein